MTEHSHVRDAEVHVVDAETCVHRLLPVNPGRVLTLSPLRVSAAAQCPRQPVCVVAGMPSCEQHLSWVIGYEHGRGNPDVVVRPWP